MLKLSKQKILVLIAEKGWTMAETARKIGMQPNNLTVLLSRGYCQTVTAGKLAAVLEVPVSEILED